MEHVDRNREERNGEKRIWGERQLCRTREMKWGELGRKGEKCGAREAKWCGEGRIWVE